MVDAVSAPSWLQERKEAQERQEQSVALAAAQGAAKDLLLQYEGPKLWRELLNELRRQAAAIGEVYTEALADVVASGEEYQVSVKRSAPVAVVSRVNLSCERTEIRLFSVKRVPLYELSFEVSANKPDTLYLMRGAYSVTVEDAVETILKGLLAEVGL